MIDSLRVPFKLACPLWVCPMARRTHRTQIGRKSDESSSTRKRKEAIVDYVSAHGVAGRAEIAEAVGLQPSRTSELLSALIKDRILVAVGSGKGRVYKVKS